MLACYLPISASKEDWRKDSLNHVLMERGMLTGFTWDTGTEGVASSVTHGRFGSILFVPGLRLSLLLQDEWSREEDHGDRLTLRREACGALLAGLQD